MNEIMRQRIRYIVECGGVFPSHVELRPWLIALVVLVGTLNVEVLALLVRLA